MINFRESLTKENDRISSLTKLKDLANDGMEMLMKTVKEALDDIKQSKDAFAKLGAENEIMKATKFKVETAIEKETRVLEELQRGLDKAKEHSNRLREQVF